MMQFVLRSAGTHEIFMQSLLTWFVCWMGKWSALIPRVSWWAPVWRWSVMWGVTAGMIITGVRALWSTPVVMSVVSMMWLGISFVWITVTVAVVSAGRGFRPLSAVSVSVLVMVVRSWSSAVPGMGFWSVMACRCTWGRYVMQTIYYYVSILITFKAMYVWAMSCYMTWFLTLETSIFFMRHNIYCW